MTEKKEINFYLRKEEYGWLSNFWRSHQVVDKHPYMSNEHYYQSQKSDYDDIKWWISNAPTPYLAMKAGHSLRKGKGLRDDWDDVKISVMYEGLLAKFSQNDTLRQLLIMTGDAIIHEDSPTDMFWGKKGADWLGKLLMDVRTELKKEE